MGCGSFRDGAIAAVASSLVEGSAAVPVVVRSTTPAVAL